MAENIKQMYTKQGYQELVDELKYLKLTRREEIKEQIAVARGFGDLSENAEYDEARNEQAKVEARIQELENLIENAEIIDESAMDQRTISLGSVVRLYDEDENEELTYSIVGSNQADPLDMKISDQSPIGRALMGKRAGDRVIVAVPAGELHFHVQEVTRSGH
ncbi:MAG: transcription elongation factor GreA [Clostridia bacterium]|nr:transcription elongation factor GreA [Clostridia bacterium]MBQ1982173.1 transcription elongation factor GreA [Clostridia bacterium]MBQ5725769.1 transcription elongation factor GreA [Clostridia bacterium]